MTSEDARLFLIDCQLQRLVQQSVSPLTEQDVENNREKATLTIDSHPLYTPVMMCIEGEHL